MNTLKKVLATGLVLLCSVFMCELLLRVASEFSPLIDYHLQPPWSRNLVPDERLGKRQSPFYPGHDERGYRNPRALGATEVLAVGDSMTYGFGAPPEGSWPFQLERISGIETYNAGVGGYGPAEYEIVVEELLQLEPSVLALGLYLGNDVSDAFNSVYVDRRAQHLMSTDARTLRAVDRLQTERSLHDRAVELGMKVSDAKVPVAESTDLRGLARWSSLFKLGRSLNYVLGQRRSAPLRQTREDSFEAAMERPGRLAFDAGPDLRTVFQPPKLAALALDLQDPRIQEGLRITKTVLRTISGRLSESEIDLLVVIIPSKRTAFEDSVRAASVQLGKDFDHAVELENSLKEAISSFLTENEIEFIDTLPAIRASFAGGNPYHTSDDGHPNARGYRAIAESVAAFLAGLDPATSRWTDRSGPQAADSP